jgi:hypothetical protein
MADPTDLRANFIRRDIYNRHGIKDESMPVAEALAEIATQAAAVAAPYQAWANPSQRAQARYDYAARGTNMADVENRWSQSSYLMDPHTAKYHQGYGRDIDFLRGLIDGQKAPPEQVDSGAFADVGGGRSRMLGGASPSSAEDQQRAAERNRLYHAQRALERWDNSHAPMYRKDWLTPSTYDNHNTGSVVQDTLANMDNLAGQWDATSEAGPVGDTGRMYMSGEADDYGDAWRTAWADKGYEDRFRLANRANQSPVLDMPNDSSIPQLQARLEQLSGAQQKGAIPDAGERWQRTVGWAPSPMVMDSFDNMYSYFDPSTLASLSAGGMARVPAKALLKNLATDFTVDHYVNTGLQMATSSGETPMWNYVVGTGKAPEMKTPEQLDDAKGSRQFMQNTLDAERQAGNGTFLGVSRPERDMYNRLVREGKMSPAPSRGW